MRLWVGVRGLAVKPHCQQCIVSGVFYYMKELEAKLKELQKNGFEVISIVQIQQWIAEIKRAAALKAFERKGGII